MAYVRLDSSPDRLPSPDYIRMSEVEEQKEDGAVNAPTSAATMSSSSNRNNQPPQSADTKPDVDRDAIEGILPLPMPEPSASHVSVHKEMDEDEVAAAEHSGAALSPKSHGESSSQEPSALRMAEWKEAVTAAASSSSPGAPAGSVGVIHPDSSIPPTLVAFINFRSGGRKGEAMTKVMVEELGAEYVYDLIAEKGPSRGLRRWKGTPNLRVVIGGGDGSINWVLSQMRMEGMTDVPVGCIPLGTGNDASRAFGWGYSNPSKKKMKQNLQRMKSCPPESMMRYDRFHMLIQYEHAVSEEFARTLPDCLRPVTKREDIPPFERKAQKMALPVVAASTATKSKSNGKHQPHEEKRPQPQHAASIDVDAHEQGYNVQAISLADRDQQGQNEQNHDPDRTSSDIPLKRLPHDVQQSEARAEADADADGAASADIPRLPPSGPGAIFGGEFNNYLSFGVDAQIQGWFHHAREGSCRPCFCCRPCNMAWMGCMGFTNCVSCASKNLNEAGVAIEVRNETGRWVALPLPKNLRSIVLLNTPTYGGGRFLWGRDPTNKSPRSPKKFECSPQRQRFDDGLFEIVAITSIWHLGGIMGKMTRGMRLAQVNEARITFQGRVWTQTDGEPFLDYPSTYHIRPLKSQLMLTRPERVVHT